MTIDEIEFKVAQGELTARQTFTQMRQWVGAQAMPLAGLTKLGAERHADLMAFLPDFEKWLAARTEHAEEMESDGLGASKINLSAAQARWVLNCMAFVATLPKHIEAKPEPRAEGGAGE